MFSGIKYILGYADESPNQLNQENDATNASGASPDAKANNDAAITDGAKASPDGSATSQAQHKHPQTAQAPAMTTPPALASLDARVANQQEPNAQSQSNDDWCLDDGSIDMDDMDESWEVIPPPCFTGDMTKLDQANGETASGSKIEQQPREAARENALIEHPSFYIASSSQDNQQKDTEKVEAKLCDKPLDLAKRIKLRTCTSKQLNPSPRYPLKGLAKKTVRLDTVPQVVANRPTKKPIEDAAWMSEDDADVIIEKASVNKRLSVANRPDHVSTASLEKAEEPVFKLSPIKKRFSNKKATSSGEKAKLKVAPTGTARSMSEKKAWKNKFIVDAWDIDDQEDADSDFENMFEPARKKKSPTKSKPKQQQQQPQQRGEHCRTKATFSEEAPKEGPIAINVASIESNLEESSIHSDDTIENIAPSSETSDSIELISMRKLLMDDSIITLADENLSPQSDRELHESIAQDCTTLSMAKSEENRKRLVQVRPIEPERRPGWQLKRQRSKRRPLGASTVANKQPTPNGKSRPSPTSTKTDATANSQSSSSRSSPTFIDRIGSSIVANLTNLTNGLVSSGALVEGGEKIDRTIATNSHAAVNMTNPAVRKNLSKGFLNRQNICSQQSHRRPDRRLKMFATPNGCSVNRKVHTSIH